jgi:hypothetical protein
MGDDHEDDIPDPIGRPRADFEATVRELDILLRRLVDLMIGGAPRSEAHTNASASLRIHGGTRSTTGGL